MGSVHQPGQPGLRHGCQRRQQRGRVRRGALASQAPQLANEFFLLPRHHGHYLLGLSTGRQCQTLAIGQQILTEALIQPGLLDRTPHLLPIVVQVGRRRVLPSLQIGQQHPAALPIHLGDQAPVTAPLLLMQLFEVKHQVLDLLKSHLCFLLPSTSCQYKKTPLLPRIKAVVFCSTSKGWERKRRKRGEVGKEIPPCHAGN